MTRGTDVEQLQGELVDACSWGEEDRAREVVSRFGVEPRARVLLDPKDWGALEGLLVLLEKTPDELHAWARDPAVSVERKARVVTVLDAELPVPLAATLPSFISAASSMVEEAVSQEGEASRYCDRLFSLLLLYKEQVLPSLPEEARTELRTLARRLVAAADPSCSLGAAVILQHVGRPEDSAFLDAHRPAEPVLAKVFDDASRALRGIPRG